MSQPGDEALVVRFRPVSADAVWRSAGKEYRRDGHHGVSVFADEAAVGESEEDLLRRLLVASELAHVSVDSNPDYWVCARAGDLKGDGFRFRKDQYDGEVAEHYCVELGADPGIEDASRFVAHFGDKRRRG